MDFDSSLSLEDLYYQEGYEEGHNVGKVQGLIEGRVYGSELSYERFEALGRLYGRVDVWQMQHNADVRIMKHVNRIRELLDNVPRNNEETAEGCDFESLFASITTKMKIICSITGEDNLVKQGILTDLSRTNEKPDLEDGAELAVRLRGGSKKACAT